MRTQPRPHTVGELNNALHNMITYSENKKKKSDIDQFRSVTAEENNVGFRIDWRIVRNMNTR